MEILSESAINVGNISFLNHSTDGVSYESEWNRNQVYEYLEGKSNRLSLVDPNHNAKNLRHQILGGSCTGIIGDVLLIFGY